MPKRDRAVLEVLFPEVWAKLLQLLFTLPSKEHYVRELMSKSDLALHTVQDELRKLSAVGLINSRSNGYHRFYRANRDHVLFEHLVRIVQLSARLPNTKNSALHRKTGQAAAKRRPRRRPMPVDRPVKWHLFSRRRG